MLTGKAKEDFERWKFMNSHTYIYALPEIFQISLIIEWFDSIGIIIISDYNDVNYKFNYNIYFNPQKEDIYIRPILNSRQEGLREGIKKANEIYNNRNY